ncbi:hypothetical protein RXS06_13525, partial [Pseudomonas aeruginosa]|nr:hypothetical protein [Pseudomonas aeruginosa]
IAARGYPPGGIPVRWRIAPGRYSPYGLRGTRVGRIAARGYPPDEVPVRWRIALGRYSPYG